MTNEDPGDGGGLHKRGEAASDTRSAPMRIGARPIVWTWWLLAGLFSLALWAGIVSLAT
ncbi:hypothetical protein [Novosphingobium guangzhouense]|uniref:hypothetical protein n=1 Tax=Novosphingobium guangzhouense TaxID=1850347 RepID=UPI001475AE76|nr:hypothetical protein [Novosphingobium guangzhouense]